MSKENAAAKAGRSSRQRWRDNMLTGEQSVFKVKTVATERAGTVMVEGKGGRDRAGRGFHRVSPLAPCSSQSTLLSYLDSAPLPKALFSSSPARLATHPDVR